MYKIGIQFEFEAGHYLTGLPVTHKCSRPHGHNYIVIAEFRSEELNEVGFVIDYFDAKPIRAFLDAEWDHRMLNDVVTYNPTVENMCRDLFERFKAQYPTLYAIEIRETPTTFARYERP